MLSMVIATEEAIAKGIRYVNKFIQFRWKDGW